MAINNIIAILIKTFQNVMTLYRANNSIKK